MQINVVRTYRYSYYGAPRLMRIPYTRNGPWNLPYARTSDAIWIQHFYGVRIMVLVWAPVRLAHTRAIRNGQTIRLPWDHGEK